jgi:hypothetical protein
MKVFGFTRTPSPAQKRRNAEIRFRKGTEMQIAVEKKPHNGREPFALELMLDKAFKSHSDGKLDNVGLSDVLRGLADAAYPGDKNAMSKFVEANKAAFAAKVTADHAALYSVDDAHQHARETLAVGNGIGIGPRAAGGNTYAGTAAADDGTNVTSPTDGTMRKHANLVTKENVDVLMKKYGLNFDQAVTMLARGK